MQISIYMYFAFTDPWTRMGGINDTSLANETPQYVQKQQQQKKYYEF